MAKTLLPPPILIPSISSKRHSSFMFSGVKLQDSNFFHSASLSDMPSLHCIKCSHARVIKGQKKTGDLPYHIVFLPSACTGRSDITSQIHLGTCSRNLARTVLQASLLQGVCALPSLNKPCQPAPRMMYRRQRKGPSGWCPSVHPVVCLHQTLWDERRIFRALIDDYSCIYCCYMHILFKIFK